LMASHSPELSHGSRDAATADKGAATSPLDVIVDLAHTVIRNLQAENLQLADENERLRRRLDLIGALIRPLGVVLQ
jgi:hypothetical protein